LEALKKLLLASPFFRRGNEGVVFLQTKLGIMTLPLRINTFTKSKIPKILIARIRDSKE